MSNLPNIKLFCDTGNLEELKKFANDERFTGFTTNPSLIAKEIGDKSYIDTIKEILQIIPVLPVSFEVVSDEYDEMHRQALLLSGLGDNVYVKIPVVNPDGTNNVKLVNELTSLNVKVNLTCVASLGQLKDLVDCKNLIISVFAGRILDTLNDAKEICSKIKRFFPNAQILWASMRELYNIKQAADCNCDIITVPTSYIAKFNWFDYSLDDVSRLSSEQFLGDAKKAGLEL
jgi:transaldolase